MFIGREKGFGQRFDPPEHSPYLTSLLPYCGEYTRSRVTLKLIRDDIKENRLNEKATRPNDYLLDEAIRRTRHAFQLPELVKPLHLNDVFQQDLPIWSSSPGLPWTQYGYKTKGDIRKDPDAINRIRHFWHRIKTGHNIRLPDCCAFVRSHICKSGEAKVRAVWGYPATVTFAEAMFALPLIRAYQTYRTPIAYGYETGIGGMRKIFQQFKGQYFLGIDFTKFDKTLPAWLIRTAFDILAYNIDFTKYQDHGVPFAPALLKMWNLLSDYCINTRIRMCNGERYMKRAGLASGSYFTQLVGSICNHILLTYAALKRGVEIRDILVFGDDSILSTDDSLTPDDIQDALEPFGLVINVAKSGYSKNISNLSFLGYRINDGFPKKAREKSFASLVWPERNDRNWDDLASRALGIMYANLGVDPVVDYVCRRIVEFRSFDIVLTRDQQRYLSMLKLEIGRDVPTMLEFMLRL
uniref:RdRp n=1 Tax=Wuhan insect virus 24 TaxID=1923728 RepID=A0A1L3KLK3_9VIRU|nr:RdRp [Wuhan insect virus 24]